MVTYKAVLWNTTITTTYWLSHVKKVLIYLKNKKLKPSAPYCFDLLLIAEMCLSPQ